MPSVGPMPNSAVSFVSFCHCLESQSVIFSTVFSCSSILNESTRGRRCLDKEPLLGIRHSTFRRTQSDKSSPDGTRPSQPFATKHTDMVSPSPHDEGILREAQLSYLSFQVQVQVQGTVVLLESSPSSAGVLYQVPAQKAQHSDRTAYSVLRTAP